MVGAGVVGAGVVAGVVVGSGVAGAAVVGASVLLLVTAAVELSCVNVLSGGWED